MTWGSRVISLSLQKKKSTLIGWNELGIVKNQSGLFKLGLEESLCLYGELARKPALITDWLLTSLCIIFLIFIWRGLRHEPIARPCRGDRPLHCSGLYRESGGPILIQQHFGQRLCELVLALPVMYPF